MKVLFGSKHYGKDISEVPSGFLVWCIEEYANADWLLIQECKKELSYRLKLEWTYPPKPLTQKEILDMFKRDILDGAYKGGISEEKCNYIAKEQISWTPPKEAINYGETIVKFIEEITRMKKENEFLFDVIGMSVLCNGNRYTIEGYMANPKYMYSQLKLIRNANQ